MRLSSICLSLPVWLVATVVFGQATRTETFPIRIQPREDRITVSAGQELFTEYVTRDQPRPILYPLNAAGELSMVRNFPMRSDVAGEATDHPHHRSVWLAHGDVNGLDFWSGKSRIRHRQIDEWLPDGFVASNDWIDGDRAVCSDRTTIRFQARKTWRWVDYKVTITAGSGPVVFGDTKEGLFAIRTHPRLRIRDQEGHPMATAFNSEGVSGVGIWGQSARWVHYQNTINDRMCAVTMLDHPNNLRHPTLWHARDYGLIAANPFGLHDLAGEPAGTGSWRIEAGQSLTLRYGIVVWNAGPDREEMKPFSRNLPAVRTEFPMSGNDGSRGV